MLSICCCAWKATFACPRRAAKTPIAQLPLNLLSVILDRAAPLVPFITEVERFGLAQRYDSLHMPSMSVGDQQCCVLHLRTSDRQKPWLDSPAVALWSTRDFRMD